MRSNTLFSIGITLVLALLSASLLACWPPIHINVVTRGGEDAPSGALSGTVTIVATPPASAEMDAINFFVDGKWIGKAVREPFTIEWDTTTVANGKHEIWATGLSTDGRKLDSNRLIVVVDNTSLAVQ